MNNVYFTIASLGRHVLEVRTKEQMRLCIFNTWPQGHLTINPAYGTEKRVPLGWVT